ncbi:MAG: aspartate aminotransferase family protein, partial [Clostridia bacterium]|nr:aspartate aminotransferase family protein [Clostridia bacterium]
MFIDLDQMAGMPVNELEGLYRAHCNSAFYKLLDINGLNRCFAHAEGIYLWDSDGRRYMDFVGGYGSLNLGHNHPRVIRAVEAHFGRPNLLQENANLYNAVLAYDISELTRGQLPVCSFTNCGTETVEEAVKLAYMYKKQGAIVYCSNAYHGKTLGSISAYGNKAKKNYPTLDKTFVEIPFGDAGKLGRAIRKHDVAAFLVEPVQGEGGIVTAPEGYFQQVRALCDEHDIVLIFDEIQTGIGRCGTMFCYEQLGIVPDILCLSKSLGGGIMPIGCIAVRQKMWDAAYGKLLNATLPTTTFGGNTLACVAGIEALSVVREEALCERAAELGKYALRELNALRLKHEMITQVRGMGLFIGIEFGSIKKFPVKAVVEFMISTILSKMFNQHHILCAYTSNNPAVLRFEPPLIVT